MFFVMERIHENYACESLPCMHVHSAGTHLHCVNNKQVRSTFIYGYANILPLQKIPAIWYTG